MIFDTFLDRNESILVVDPTFPMYRVYAGLYESRVISLRYDFERGFPQQEIAESAYRFQQAVERKEKVIVGVNDFVQEDEPPIETLYIDERAGEAQLDKLEKLRRTRDRDRVSRALDRMRETASTSGNLMPVILDAVRAYATVGEMCDVLREVWGEYEETAVV